MSDPFIGEICCFAFNFAPRQWAQCNGQTMQISQNSALFAILGTTYGGNGQSTFALPNLQGQVPMHWGTGTGPAAGFNTVIGESTGSPTVTLLQSNLPSHTHTAFCAKQGTSTELNAVPSATSYISRATAGQAVYQTNPTISVAFAPNAISPNGGSLPHNNMQPYLAMNFCISLYGNFPARN